MLAQSALVAETLVRSARPADKGFVDGLAQIGRVRSRRAPLAQIASAEPRPLFHAWRPGA